MRYAGPMASNEHDITPGARVAATLSTVTYTYTLPDGHRTPDTGTLVEQVTVTVTGDGAIDFWTFWDARTSGALDVTARVTVAEESALLASLGPLPRIPAPIVL